MAAVRRSSAAWEFIKTIKIGDMKARCPVIPASLKKEHLLSLCNALLAAGKYEDTTIEQYLQKCDPREGLCADGARFRDQPYVWPRRWFQDSTEKAQTKQLSTYLSNPGNRVKTHWDLVKNKTRADAIGECSKVSYMYNDNICSNIGGRSVGRTIPHDWTLETINNRCQDFKQLMAGDSNRAFNQTYVGAVCNGVFELESRKN